MDNIVKIGLEEDTDMGKFLQVYLDKKPYLILTDYMKIHYKALEEFLRRRRAKFETVQLRGPEFGPPPMGQRYRLVGAGVFDIDDSSIDLRGESAAYEIGPNKNHAQRLSKLTGKKIKVVMKQ